jgi:hypothetical protein
MRTFSKLIVELVTGEFFMWLAANQGLRSTRLTPTIYHSVSYDKHFVHEQSRYLLRLVFPSLSLWWWVEIEKHSITTNNCKPCVLYLPQHLK